jgi:hypothetical protein
MQRLHRVFAIDISTCPRCGGQVRVIAAITESALNAFSHEDYVFMLSGETPIVHR